MKGSLTIEGDTVRKWVQNYLESKVFVPHIRIMNIETRSYSTELEVDFTDEIPPEVEPEAVPDDSLQK